MRKKWVATLIAGAVMSTGIIGFTACGDGAVNLNLNTGNTVNAEGWLTAFTKSYDATNYSSEFSKSSNITVTGTKNEEAVNYAVKANESGKAAYDAKNSKSYYEVTSSSSGNMESDGEKMTGDYKSEEKHYYELKENKNNIKTYWDARKTFQENSIKSDKGSSSNKEDVDWYVYGTTNHLGTSNATPEVAGRYFFVTKESTASEEIVNLYNKFEYANGVYTANLWMSESAYIGDSSVLLRVKCTVSVAVSGGCIVGYQVEADYSDTLKSPAASSDSYDYEYRVVVKETYNFSYGTTTVTAPTDAAKAIERATEREKDENN